MRMRRWLVLPMLMFMAAADAVAAVPLLLQQPTISSSQVAFAYGGELWVVARGGGTARQLTEGPGTKSNPRFSPDGAWIAYTADPDGNRNVYVIAARGGTPRRVTYHPGEERVTGWSPDGRRILFEGIRASYSTRVFQMFSVPVEGGLATLLPLPMAYQGRYSPDGTRLAYSPTPNGIVFGGGHLLGWEHAFWRHYRGGLQPRIWLARLSDSTVEKVPGEGSNDFSPMWVGADVYFLSDRAGATTVFAYDTRTRAVRQVVRSGEADIRSADAVGDALVYERPGALHMVDLTTGRDRALSIRVPATRGPATPRAVGIARYVQSARLTADGRGLAIEARGEILVGGSDGSGLQNVTNTSGAAEREPAWSPDGRTLAYFSDASGRYELHLRSLPDHAPVRRISLGDGPQSYYAPVWSPDGQRILFLDSRRGLWCVSLIDARVTRVDVDQAYSPRTEIPEVMTASWSPDGRWIAYNRQLPNRLRAVFAYDVQSGARLQLTDGSADAESPVFDPRGDRLYFTASTQLATRLGWLDMSSFAGSGVRRVYALPLRSDAPPPGGEADAPPAAVTIDAAGIFTRALELPIRAQDFIGLWAGRAGELYLLRAASSAAPAPELFRYASATGALESVATGVSALDVARNGAIVYRSDGGWRVLPPGGATAGPVPLDAVTVQVDRRQEWRQIFREALRVHRDQFYAPNFHGQDLDALERRYRPLLDSVRTREDLNYLLRLMLGHLAVGHLFVSGGDFAPRGHQSIGLLGADFEIDAGHYRFARVFASDPFTPGVRAPLDQPGARVAAGDYLLAVDGVPIDGTDDIHRRLIDTADRAVRLTVGPRADGTGARDIVATPLSSDLTLRNRAWVNDNRQRVASLSYDRVAYIYMPDTGIDGYRSFNREFFAQGDREGTIVDLRFNSGGTVADYALERLAQPLRGWFYFRDHPPMRTPAAGVIGPRALITNEYSASGGDAMPFLFRRAALGPIVGKKTWGGLVGINDSYALIDGGLVTPPCEAFFTPEGDWAVENHGVAPDIDVELDPAAWRQGRDPQLERAVAEVRGRLPAVRAPPTVPAFPVYPR
jgi:tricorn protease